MSKLLASIAFFVACLVLCCRTYTITPYVRDGVPSYAEISTAPFVKIGQGYYFFQNTTKRNWFDAYEHCRQLGAELVTFDTLDEFNLILKYRKSMGDNERYWTSGTDWAERGNHIWFSNGVKINLDIWTPGNPDNYQNKERCDELGWRRPNSNIDGLNDCDCLAALHYICEAHRPHTASFVIW